MTSYWLEQTEADMCSALGTSVWPGTALGQDGRTTEAQWEWLGERELFLLNGMRIAKRRADWLLGRWTAKQAVAVCLCLPADMRSLAEIEVRPAPSGAPEIFLGNTRAPLTISLSHRTGRAVCALATCRGALGCDLELTEPHSDAFIADYFSPEEQALIARMALAERPWLVTLLWSAKESALKALHAGLRLDTRSVIVTPALRSQDLERENYAPSEDPINLGLGLDQREAVNSWRELRVQHVGDQIFQGWWQNHGNVVRTIVAAPPPARPLLLKIQRSGGSSSGADLRMSRVA